MCISQKKGRSESDYCKERNCACIKLCKKKGAFESKQLGGFCYMKIWKIIDIVELSDKEMGIGKYRWRANV